MVRKTIEENKEKALEVLESICKRHDFKIPLEVLNELVTYMLLSQVKTSVALIGKYKGKEEVLLKEVNRILDEYELYSINKVRK